MRCGCLHWICSQNGLPSFLVTPIGSRSNRPQEIEIGESGFALLFPQIEGIKIKPFHFIKDPKKLTLERHQLTEVGKLLCLPLIAHIVDWFCLFARESELSTSYCRCGQFKLVINRGWCNIFDRIDPLFKLFYLHYNLRELEMNFPQILHWLKTHLHLILNFEGLLTLWIFFYHFVLFCFLKLKSLRFYFSFVIVISICLKKTIEDTG